MTAREIVASYGARKKAATEARPPTPPQEEPAKIRKIDPGRLLGVVAPDDFDCEGVYGTFHALTADWTNAEREAAWFDIIGRVVPGKYQYKFTETDWRRVYADFTGRTDVCADPTLGL